MSQSPCDHANIILLRHGRAHGADPGGRYFTRDATPLSDVGRQEARAAAEHLAELGIDRILSSDMARAVETATIVAGRLNLTPSFHAELREIDCGATDGCSESEFRERFPRHTGLLDVGFLGGFPTGRNHVPAELAYPGGESIAQVADRAVPFFSGLCADTIGTTTLIVSHAWVLTTLLCHVIEAPITSYYRFHLDNTGTSYVRADANGRGVIEGFNLPARESRVRCG